MDFLKIYIVFMFKKLFFWSSEILLKFKKIMKIMLSNVDYEIGHCFNFVSLHFTVQLVVSIKNKRVTLRLKKMINRLLIK